MEIKIPKSFELGALRYDVKHVDELCHGVEYGNCNVAETIVEIADTHHGKPVSECRKEQVFFHEFVHAILDILGKEDLNSDEEFVEAFSNMLCQGLKSFK